VVLSGPCPAMHLDVRDSLDGPIGSTLPSRVFRVDPCVKPSLTFWHLENRAYVCQRVEDKGVVAKGVGDWRE
jgi:hypothetical protein